MRRAAKHALSIAVLAGAALALAGAQASAADEPPVETGDGVKGCVAFIKKNDRELSAWQAEQPPVPYEYPKRDDIGNAPWGAFLKSMGDTGALLLASILPSAGAQIRTDTPAAVVSWPWQLPLGPAHSCSRKQGSFTVEKHRAHRIVLEPGIVSSNRGIGFFTRPGYRFIQHPADWVVGVGAGLGSTIEIAGQREPFRFGIGPEILLHFGRCCEPSYFTLALRYERFFKGTALDVFTTTLGYTFF